MHSHALKEPHRRHNALAQFFSAEMRVIIFGLEDSLVSTLGAITGIAAGTANYGIVLLSGIVIVIAEALSMTAGEYLSAKSAHEVWTRRMEDERQELIDDPEKERAELVEFYIKKGYSEQDAKTIAATVWKNEAWTLEEMAIHELEMDPAPPDHPGRGAIFMFLSYLGGGIIPLLPYALLPLATAIPVSIVATAISLFLIGALKTKITDGHWWKSGLEMMGISLATAAIGYVVGIGVSELLGMTLLS